MDSRPLIKNKNKLGILIDSETFEYYLIQKNRVANAILNLNGYKNLRIIRTPMDTKIQKLNEIVEYKLTYYNKQNTVNNQNKIEIISSNIEEIHLFKYQIENLRIIAERFNDQDTKSLDVFEKLVQIFVQATLNRSERFSDKNNKSNIFISEDKFLLQNRYWFESHFPQVPLNIVTVDESSHILDLFLKNNESYHAHQNIVLNKGYWYWLSMREKLPHYNVGHEMLNALAIRSEYILMAFDEIGKEYYSGVNNDSMDNTLYHFNYLITLITGILDNLALATDDLLKIQFSDKIHISLSNKSGDKFLRRIRDINPSIRNHINSNVDFIKLVYIFRELIVHREGIEKTAYSFRDGDSKYNFNLIKISKETSDLIYRCGDQPNKFDIYSKWGQINDPEHLLVPYHFSKELIMTLMRFVDEYLKLLGNDSFIEKQDESNTEFAKTLKIFKEFHLGL